LALFVQQDTISFEFLALSFELEEIGFVFSGPQIGVWGLRCASSKLGLFVQIRSSCVLRPAYCEGGVRRVAGCGLRVTRCGWFDLFSFQGAGGSPFIIYYFVFTISICQLLAAGSGPGEPKGRAGLRGTKGPSIIRAMLRICAEFWRKGKNGNRVSACEIRSKNF
jgi:hypothetical protein